MPTYRITAPDGKAFDVTAPDGASQDDVLAYAKSQWQAPAKAPEPRTAGLGPLKSLAQGASMGFADELAGLVSAATGGEYESARRTWLEGEPGRTGQKEFAQDNPATSFGLELAGGLATGIAGAAKLGATKAGAALGRVALPQAAKVLAAGAVPGAIAGAGYAEPGNRVAGAATGAALGGAVGLAAPPLARAVGSAAQKAITSRAALGAQNAVRDATMQAGQKAGYVVAPANANPTAWNRLVQGLAGKTATGQRAAMMNQATTNRLAREALGLADDAPITYEALDAIRAQAGQAYDVLRGVQSVPLGQSYADDVAKIPALKNYLDAIAETPELADPAIDAVLAATKKDQLSGNGLIALTRMLRERADKAFRGGDKTTGKIIKGISNAMEDAGERALAGTGDEQALAAFQNARREIAKTYTVEKALNPGTGNVMASRLAGEVKKRKPLSGGLEAIGKFAAAFPRETQEVANSSWLQMPGVSPLDYAVSAGTTAMRGAAGDPNAVIKGLATLGARPAAQALATSPLYQRLMTTPNYNPSVLQRVLSNATALQGPQAAAVLGGQAGYRLNPLAP